MFSSEVLKHDEEVACTQIVDTIRTQVLGELKRKGAVVGISGGIDSSVVAALCVKAFGPDRVLGLLMPEHHSSDDALRLGKLLAESFGIETVTENIAPILESAGCYEKQNEAIRTAIPEYGDGWRCKLVGVVKHCPALPNRQCFGGLPLTIMEERIWTKSRVF